MKNKNPSGSESDEKPKYALLNWVKNHKITVALSGIFVFSLETIMNYFSNNPRMLYFPATVACLLFCWVVMVAAHKYIGSQLKETSIPGQNDSRPTRPSPESTVSKEDLQAFLEKIQKQVSELKKDGTNVNSPCDGLSGFSSQYLLRLGKPVAGRDSFFFDAGENLKRNRFSIFIDPDENLCCRVIDKDSKSIEVKVAPGLDTFLFGNVMYLVCEYGTTNNFSCVRIIINGKQVAETNQTLPILISQPVISYGTFIGADMNGTNGAVFFALLNAASHKTWSQVDLEGFMKLVYDFKVNPKTGVGGGVSFNGTGYGQTAPVKPN